jgi:multidrug resistance efflux pump
LEQAKSQSEQAKATLLGVELDAKRAKELFQGKVISEQEYTNKTQDYQSKLARGECGSGGRRGSTTEP